MGTGPDTALRDRLVAELRAESADLDGRVAGLTEDRLRVATPAVGWTVVDSLAHLAATDDDATLAMTEPDTFAGRLPVGAAAEADHTERAVRAARLRAPREVVRGWTAGHRRLADLLATADTGRRIPWFGPAMGLASFVSARVMETWAHGQDIADALGQVRPPTGRLRTVADIAVRARPYAYHVRGLPPPSPPRVALTAPDGTLWTWGPADATDTVSGSALDFCLLATRRRHLDDLGLAANGASARQWLSIAQAYAGPPGPGRAPSTVDAAS